MLGALARDLRALGVDCAYPVERGDDVLIKFALREERVLLTRDTALASRRGAPVHLVVSTDPDEQLVEVLRSYPPPDRGEWFSRCLECNVATVEVSAETVRGEVPPFVAATRDEFRRCPMCGRLFWQGTHVASLRERLMRLTTTAKSDE
jgi:uncharacterized protein with PIN domain